MKVISFSLYGTNPLYLYGAIENAKIAPEIYPGWIVRVYFHSDVSLDILGALNTYPHVQLIPFHPNAGFLWFGKFERFRPASDPDVDVVIVRDTDSRLSEREKVAVDEWLASDKNFHIIRDHPHHDTMILAGMWGVRSNLLEDMNQLLDRYAGPHSEYCQVADMAQDQYFLRKIIYPRVINDAVVHASFHKYEPFAQEIKHERKNGEYIGERVGIDGSYNEKARQLVIDVNP